MSLAPEAILRLSKADYIVVSDGGEPFRVLLECLEKAKRNPSQIPGVGSIINGCST